MEKSVNSRREREKEARRELILDAAARVFSDKNYYEATIDEIAAEAELAKGTLYNYFKDKLDIFESLSLRGQELLINVIEQLSKEQYSLEEFIGHTFKKVLAVMNEHQYILRMLISAGLHLSEQEHSRIQEGWHKHTEKVITILNETIGKYPETRNLPLEERIVAAGLLLGAIRLMFFDSVFAKYKSISQTEIDNCTRLLCRAVNTENKK